MNKHLFVKIVSAVCAVSLCTATVTVGGGYSTASYEDEIASLEERRTALSEQRTKVQSELDKYTDAAQAQDEYLKLYDEKMSLQEEEMNNLTEQVNLLNSQISSLDIQISDKQAQVDKGIEEFKERLRAMYISGGDSISDVLTGSSNFYDVLARLEMVQRISEHDNNMITELCGKLEDLNTDKSELETEKANLEEKKSEQLTILADLQETYANHAETKQWYENKAEAKAAETEEIKANEAAVEEEMQDYIRKQQAEIAKKMAERTRKREEAKKAKEEQAQAQKSEEATQTEAQTVTEAETSASEEYFANLETSAETETVTENNWDVYTPAEASEDEFSVQTSAESVETESTESDVRTDDPYYSYEWGKTYSQSEESESDTTEEAPASDDTTSELEEKGYGTSSDTGFIWPVPTVRNITDGYGSRYIEEEGSSEFHKGIDINKPNCKGEAIVASAGGVVITASDTGNGYGIHVVIDHGDNIATLYGHMSSTTVSVGDEVTQGQVIGYIGNTGQAYGYHCHFEVRVNGQHTDPLDYVSMDN